MEKINMEVKDIVFDYFNIITKEYEMSYEKWRNDQDYLKQLKDVKENVDKEYIDKWEVPETLTRQKTEAIIKEKATTLNTIL